MRDVTGRPHLGQTNYSWCLSWWVEVLAELVFNMLPIIARRIREEGSQGGKQWLRLPLKILAYTVGRLMSLVQRMNTRGETSWC